MAHRFHFPHQSAFSVIHLLLFFCFLNSLSYGASTSFFKCISNIIPTNHQEPIIYTRQSTNYTSVLQEYIRNNRFNTSTTNKPTLILTPFRENQVQAIVTCAQKTGLHLKIRSGGHDFEGLSYTSTSPFAILDMFNLRSIKVNPEEKTAWVQSGATLGELYYRIWEKSNVLAFPAGICPTIGVGGHLSGGGYGSLMRKFGLSIDNIVDAKIVDAEGRILDRKGMGEDLFWAIRGGGGASFGVVLSYKINLVPVPPLVTVFEVPKTIEENVTDILHHWQYVADKFDRELFVRVNLGPMLGKDGQKTVGASFLALYLGDSNKLVSLITSRFPELGLKKEDCKEMTWIKSVLLWADFPDGTPETTLLIRKPPVVSLKIKSDYVTTPIPKIGLQGLFQRIASDQHVLLKFNPYGGRMGEIPESATAFPHRAGNIFKIQYLVLWDKTGRASEKKYIDILRKLYDYMTPFVSKNPRKAYLNYRDMDIGSTDNRAHAYSQAKEYGIKYFYNNFQRLVRVKTMVDPTNFFRNEQSIPPLEK